MQSQSSSYSAATYVFTWGSCYPDARGAKPARKTTDKTQVTNLDKRPEPESYDIIVFLCIEYNLAELDHGFTTDALQGLSTL
jgi:cytolysin (calcineurin-like family phosphatase)